MATEPELVATRPQTLAPPAERGLSRIILKLAWPVVVERFAISVLSAVDAVLVGRYVGGDGLAAIGLGTLMFWIPLSGAFAIDVGATAIIARDVGAGDRSRVQSGLHTAILAAFAWGVVCTIFVFAAAPLLMRLMGAEADVRPLGVEFLRWGSLGFPMLMVLYAISGSLRGMGNTWMPMLILLIVNAVNALVVYLLISGAVADLGIRASGIGFALGGTMGGGLALALAASSLSPISMDVGRLFGVSRSSFARLLRVGFPVGLEEAQFMFAFLVYTGIIATLGMDQLAAHSLALRSLEIAILPGFALGTAATALVGQYLGAGQPDTAEAVAKRVRLFAVGTLCVMAALQFTLAPYIADLFVRDDEVADIATKLLRVFSFALPGMAVHASLSGALRGAGDVRFVLGTFTFTAWGVRVPLAALMVLGFGLTAPCAWTAAVTENWVRAALVQRRFMLGKWKTLRV